MRIIRIEINKELSLIEDWSSWVSGGPSSYGFQIPQVVSDYLEPEYQKLGLLIQRVNDQFE